MLAHTAPPSCSPISGCQVPAAGSEMSISLLDPQEEAGMCKPIPICSGHPGHPNSHFAPRVGLEFLSFSIGKIRTFIIPERTPSITKLLGISNRTRSVLDAARNSKLSLHFLQCSPPGHKQVKCSVNIRRQVDLGSDGYDLERVISQNPRLSSVKAR